MPIIGPPDGWGLMQLDNMGNYATKGQPDEDEGQLQITEEHLWHWRENLEMGIGYLDHIYDEALAWLNTKYNQVHSDMNTENDWPTTGEDAWNPDQASTDDAVARRIWNDALSRYNTGDRLYSGEYGNKGQVDCGADRTDRRSRTTHTIENVEDVALVENPDDVDIPNEQFDGCDYYLDIRDHMVNTPWD